MLVPKLSVTFIGNFVSSKFYHFRENFNASKNKKWKLSNVFASPIKPKLLIKFRRITRPRFATQKKTRYSAITRVRIPSRIGGYNWTRVIFESELYERWYSSEFEPGWYLCFDWTRFCVFNIELRLNLGYRLLGLASRTNIESVPRFAKIWLGELNLK